MSKWVQPVLLLTVLGILFGAAACAEPAPQVSECELCLGVAEEDPYVCLESVSAITNDVEAIYVRARLEGPFTESHEVTTCWIDPSGEVYFEDVSTVPSASSQGYGWWNYHVTWFWIDIVGWPSSQMLGEWQVDVFVDGEERCTKTFTINLSEEAIEAIANGVEYCFGEGWVEFVGDDLMSITIDVAPEAAGFHYGFYCSAEAPYGDPAPAFHDHSWILECDGELDESGAATIEIPWPDDVQTETLFFQVLIATNPLELLSGSFWQSNVVQVDRPPQQEPLSTSGGVSTGCAAAFKSIPCPDVVRLYYNCAEQYDTRLQAVNLDQDEVARFRVTCTSSQGTPLISKTCTVESGESRAYSLRELIEAEGADMDCAFGLCVIDATDGSTLEDSSLFFGVEYYYDDDLLGVETLSPSTPAEEDGTPTSGHDFLFTWVQVVDPVADDDTAGSIAPSRDVEISVVNYTTEPIVYALELCTLHGESVFSKTYSLDASATGIHRVSDLLEAAGIPTQHWKGFLRGAGPFGFDDWRRGEFVELADVDHPTIGTATTLYADGAAILVNCRPALSWRE